MKKHVTSLIFFSTVLFRVYGQINVFDGLKEAFHGNKSDGYASLSSGAVLPQMLLGGKGDGYAARSSVVVFDNPFYGGKGDGYALRSTAVAVNDMYLGGKGDGYACCSEIGFSKSLHPLPVQLLYFHGLCKDGIVELKWATASELNSDYFTVEKSYDALHFFMLGTVPGSGSTSFTHQYSFIDKDISGDQGLAYYRIKQTDYNGDYSFSNFSYVHCNGDLDMFSGNLFPNPANQSVSLVFSTKLQGSISIEITDVLGRIIQEKNFQVAEGDNLITSDVSVLAEGIYIFKTSGFGRVTLSCQKFVKYK